MNPNTFPTKGNLILAKKERLLCQLFGFQVVMTREDDRSIHDQQAQTIREQKTSDLHNRLALMTSYSGSVAVSIHLNKVTQSYVHGAQVFYAPRSSGSERLAETIQEGFRQYLQPDDEPAMKIKHCDGKFIAKEYCNIHGLWEAQSD